MTHQQHTGRDAAGKCEGTGIGTNRDHIAREWITLCVRLIQYAGIHLHCVHLADNPCHLPRQMQITCANIQHYIIRTQLIEHSLIGRLIIVSMHRFPGGIRQCCFHVVKVLIATGRDAKTW